MQKKYGEITSVTIDDYQFNTVTLTIHTKLGYCLEVKTFCFGHYDITSLEWSHHEDGRNLTYKEKRMKPWSPTDLVEERRKKWLNTPNEIVSQFNELLLEYCVNTTDVIKIPKDAFSVVKDRFYINYECLEILFGTDWHVKENLAHFVFRPKIK